MSAETKNCQNCKQDFEIYPEDFEFYKKIDVPAPTFCYLCRAQRRMSYRNEMALFKRKCDLTGETIFSTYPSDVKFPVYKQEEWHGDKWDGKDYGRDYDFSRPFFEQFKELSDVVPRLGKSALHYVNSDYSNNMDQLKNCYLVFNAANNEDCAYGVALIHSNNCIDNSNIYKTDLSYGNFGVGISSRVFFSTNIEDSMDIWFSRKLRNCKNCFGCVNLRGKSYCWFNEQLTKEEYDKRLKEADLTSFKNLEEMKQKTHAFWAKHPVRHFEGRQNENVKGEYIYNSKNTLDTYQSIGNEDIRYCQYVNYDLLKDSYDVTVWGNNMQHSYESAMIGDGVNNCKFCLQTWTNCKNLEYCEYVQGSSDCFGCIGLKKQQYCILNKQYTKEEYEELVPKIKKHMDEMPYTDKGGRVYKYGEFPPAEFSPFGYNQTIAQEHFPKTKEEILSEARNWRDVELPDHKATVAADDLVDSTDEVGNEMLKEVIGCAHKGECEDGCTIAFKLIPQELQFLKKFGIALPRLCPTCRHRDRLKLRQGMRIYEGKCECAGKGDDGGVYSNISEDHPDHDSATHCPNEFFTSYPPDDGAIVYCENCYKAESI